MKPNKQAAAKEQADTVQIRPITAKELCIISRRILPLYERIAKDRLYAKRLISAMRTLELDRITRVIQQVLPGAEVSVGGGFSAGLSLMITKKTMVYFETGIWKKGQLLSEEIRNVSPIMLQLLRKLANDRKFAARFIGLVRTRKQAELFRLVNNAIHSKPIVSATIDEYGPTFEVRLSNGKRYNLAFVQS